MAGSIKDEYLYSRPLKSPFLRDTVLEQYLAKMGFLRDDYLFFSSRLLWIA